MLRWLMGALVATVTVTSTLTDHLPVQTEQVCLVQSRIYAPAEVEPIYIDRLAWPVGGPALPEPLTLNGRAPVSSAPELYCMAGGPVTGCPMGALHWSVRFSGFVTQPGAPLLLPDAPMGTMPPMLLMMYNTAGTVSTPSPQAGPQPLPGPDPGPVPSPVPVAGVASANVATPIAITSSILFGIVSLGLVGLWQHRRRLPCPYCSAQLMGGTEGLREHLKRCGEHLALFQPVILETVQRVVDRQSIHVEMPAEQEEREDLIARPEGGV
jgi:hypothetical protein